MFLHVSPSVNESLCPVNGARQESGWDRVQARYPFISNPTNLGCLATKTLAKLVGI